MTYPGDEDHINHFYKYLKALMAYDAAGNEITSIVLTTDKNGKASTDNEQFYDVNGNTIDGILPYVFLSLIHI